MEKQMERIHQRGWIMSVPHAGWQAIPACPGAGTVLCMPMALGAHQDPAPAFKGNPLALAFRASIMAKDGLVGTLGTRTEAVRYILRTIRAKRLRLIARPRVALLSRAGAGAALCSLSLHRSPWQHWMTSEPLLTWPCWL